MPFSETNPDWSGSWQETDDIFRQNDWGKYGRGWTTLRRLSGIKQYSAMSNGGGKPTDVDVLIGVVAFGKGTWPTHRTWQGRNQEEIP